MFLKRPRHPAEPPTYAVCFDPITIAIVAGTAAVVGAAGSISAGAAQRNQFEAEAQIQTNQASAQAEVLRQQAERERVVAAEQEGDFRAQQSRAAASVRAAAGARGIDISTGSPLLAAQDFARQTTRQALRIREGGAIQAHRLEQQGFLLEQNAAFQGPLLRARGDDAFRAGLFGAGTSLLSGGTRVARILQAT